MNELIAGLMLLRTSWRFALATSTAVVILASSQVQAQSQAPRVAIGPFSGADSDEVAVKLGGFLDLHSGEIEPIPGSTYFVPALGCLPRSQQQ